MWQLSNITHPLPRKGNIWHSLFLCVGEVLLKQWKQGNTWFGKTRKRPLEIGVFFLWKLNKFREYPYLYRRKGMSSIQEKPKPLRLQRRLKYSLYRGKGVHLPIQGKITRQQGKVGLLWKHILLTGCLKLGGKNHF